MNGPWTHDFEADDTDGTALLEASTGFSVLEEDPDNGETLQVLERQLSTLLVQLDNLEEDLSNLANGSHDGSAQDALSVRLQDQAERLTARIKELEAQIDALS